MSENLIEAHYDVTKKSRLRKFYEENKILIIAVISILIIAVASISFYFDIKEKKKISLSENYIEAKIYIENNNLPKAKDLLKKIIFSDNGTYSTLSFFLILEENLITDQNELLSLFNYVIKNNNFDKEVKNLLIFKKALFQSNFVNEIELLETMKPLVSTENLWKPHALLLLGDYFVSKKEYLKAKEFFLQVLSLKNLNKAFYQKAQSQLLQISNE